MFNFRYEFDLFGKYKKQYESALGEKHASRLAFEQAKNILSASIAKSYFNLSAMKAKKEVVVQMFQNKERLLSLVRLRKKNKISSKVEENTVNEALKACDIEFGFVDVLAQPEMRENLPKFSDWPTFPQLFINGELIGGCDIAMDMFEKGELQKMTKEAVNK